MMDMHERSALRSFALLLTLSLSAACAGTVATVGEPVGEPEQTVVPSTPDFADVAEGVPTGAVHERRLAGSGQEVFEAVCSGCHTLAPPRKHAPPMAMLARRYRNVHAEEDGAREAMVRWVAAPAAERSVLPERALEEFGLMPAPPLSRPLVERVVDYVLSLDGAEAGEPGMEAGAHASGEGHSCRHGGRGSGS